MTAAEWLVDRFKVIRGSLDGSADKLWRFYKGRIKELEEQLAEAQAGRDMFQSAFDLERQRTEILEKWVVGERQDHEHTRARLVRAAKRCVRLRDEAVDLKAIVKFSDRVVWKSYMVGFERTRRQRDEAWDEIERLKAMLNEKS